MIRSTRFLLIIIVTITSSQEQIQQPINQLPFSITINCAQPPLTLQNVVHNNPQISSAIEQETIVTQKQESIQNITMLTDIQIKGESLLAALKTIGFNHYGKIIVVSIIGIITSMFFYLYSMKNFLHDRANQWCLWRIDEHEIILQQHDNQQINDLLHAIQMRYYNIYNPTDNTAALTQFSIAIEKEKKILNHYLKICSIMHTCYVDKIPGIPIYQAEAQAALNHADFLEKQFLTWLCNKNIQKL